MAAMAMGRGGAEAVVDPVRRAADELGAYFSENLAKTVREVVSEAVEDVLSDGAESRLLALQSEADDVGREVSAALGVVYDEGWGEDSPREVSRRLGEVLPALDLLEADMRPVFEKISSETSFRVGRAVDDLLRSCLTAAGGLRAAAEAASRGLEVDGAPECG